MKNIEPFLTDHKSQYLLQVVSKTYIIPSNNLHVATGYKYLIVHVNTTIIIICACDLDRCTCMCTCMYSF